MFLSGKGVFFQPGKDSDLRVETEHGFTFSKIIKAGNTCSDSRTQCTQKGCCLGLGVMVSICLRVCALFTF